MALAEWLVCLMAVAEWLECGTAVAEWLEALTTNHLVSHLLDKLGLK